MNYRLSILLPAAALLILSACKKDSPDPAPAPPSGGGGTMPVLTTQNVTSITGTTATAGGTVSAEGGSAVTARGVAWGTAQNPTTANSTTSDGSGEGDFASIITGLIPNTDYYVRAYAINSTGTAYGNQVTFTTPDGGGGSDYLNPDLTYGSVTDQNGNAYATIVIGTQEWMAENLRTTNYANGDPIPNVTDAGQWGGLTTGAWAHFDNDDQYENPYGKLYNWYAVADPRNVCPNGWHVPTESEWSQLELELGLPPGEVNDIDFIGTAQNVGGKMKATALWDDPNTGATNESGFSGLPGGFRSTGAGTFLNSGDRGFWWSASENSTQVAAWRRHLYYSNAGIYRVTQDKRAGFSARCVRD